MKRARPLFRILSGLLSVVMLAAIALELRSESLKNGIPKMVYPYVFCFFIFAYGAMSGKGPGFLR